MLSFFSSPKFHFHTEPTKISTICRHLNTPTPIRVWLYHKNPWIYELIQPSAIIWSSSGTLESLDSGRGTWSSRRKPTQNATRDDPTAPRAATACPLPPPRWCFCNFKCSPLPNRSLYCTTCLQSPPDMLSQEAALLDTPPPPFLTASLAHLAAEWHLHYTVEKLMNLTPPFFGGGGDSITSVSSCWDGTFALIWNRVYVPLLSAEAISRRKTL